MNNQHVSTSHSDKADMVRVVKWIGFAYLPIAILVIIIFILVEYHYGKIEHREEATVLTTPLK